MSTEYLLAFILPVLFALVITPRVIRFAIRIGATDQPGGRKIHTDVTPRIGGVAVFLSIALSSGILYLLFPDVFAGLLDMPLQSLAAAVCLVSIFSLGFVDDLKPLKPGIKFGVQFLIAGLIYFAGFKISNITNPVGAGMLNLDMFDFPLTVLWIVGITNAFNLIDGLDGLSSGVAAIACISIFMVSAVSDQFIIAIAALLMAGALTGFLRYNFRPAKIFLGDSGSLLIGFTLAVLSIQSTTKISTGMALLFPTLVLGLPITDTLVSMLRRFLSNYMPGKTGVSTSILNKLNGMFTPDRAHIHHRLLSLGFTHRNSVLVLYSVSAFFAFFAFAITQIENVEKTYTVAMLVGFILVLGVKKLRYREIAIFNNGMIMPFFERWILNRTTYLVIADFCFILVAFILSNSLIQSISPSFIQFSQYELVLLMVLAVQFLVFWATGLYRETIRQMGIGNVLGVIASVGYATVATAFVLLVTDIIPLSNTLQLMVVNFYFLLTCTLGLRVAWQALSYWFNRDKESGINVLIYGANENGTMILHKINHSTRNQYKVLGFLDDDPDMEGKFIYGYPIIGSHWKLAKSRLAEKIDYIFLCEDDIKPEDFNRLSRFAKTKQIQLKRLDVKLKNVNTRTEVRNNVPGSLIDPAISTI